MQIKEVENKTGLTKKAIRYYEENGLIVTAKKENGYKEYEEKTIERLIEIKRLRLLDFTVSEIKEYFMEDNKNNLISSKIHEQEEKQQRVYAIKQILEKMLEGKSIDHIDVEKNLLAEKKRKYLYIRKNNLAFGFFNLAMYIIILSYFLVNWNIQEVFGLDISGLFYFGFNILILIVTVASILKREKRKKLGLDLLERKLSEILLFIVLAVCFYFNSAYMLREGFYNAKMMLLEWNGDWFQVLGNAGMGIVFAIFSLMLVVYSFQDSNKKSEEFL
ncbi:MerR family transcriptional regulator [Anaerosacchariphilus polymeriproducens]|uniref:MerR family transcriptional regulator n=1 Tax=Anaerosacchariphilus polymeriproducens TaxID=1812858 RepID=A0A371AVL8_9FIRM|nr:MerR family transcriptional regulator [Anaerosacchariphilus polymeriproducens]RDU23613.1 MerR family transcriptional regulator [Anaerosacchariphilus polymeriproducens]